MKKILLFLAVFIFANQAFAQNAHRSGFYIGVNGGLAFPQDSAGKLFDGYAHANLSFNRGLSAGAMVGYDFSRFFRAEFEFNYKKSKMDTLSVTYSPKTYLYTQGGNVRTLSYMANAYLQYPLTDVIVPYIGVGVGLADIRMDKPRACNCSHGTTSRRLLAYQGIVGVGLNVSENVTLSFDYRYFTTKEGKFETNVQFHPTFKTRISSHNVMIGVRYKF
ncbi:MAG TPA: outer membrane beta-barrel protein [Alphaproteobacteria bacterium]|nr:outer membrane beta-barrel protein [Alphaproteobacteria bacterium]